MLRYYLTYNKARIFILIFFKNRSLKFEFKLKPTSLFAANEIYV